MLRAASEILFTSKNYRFEICFQHLLRYHLFLNDIGVFKIVPMVSKRYYWFPNDIIYFQKILLVSKRYYLFPKDIIGFQTILFTSIENFEEGKFLNRYFPEG